MMTTEPGICLIGGTGRSGTTILKDIFGKHRDAVAVPEWRFTIDPDGLVDFLNTFATGWSPFWFDRKARRLRQFLQRLGKRQLLPTLWERAFRIVGVRRGFGRKLVPAYEHFSVSSYSPNYYQLIDKLMDELADFRYRGRWEGTELFEEEVVYLGLPRSEAELARILGNFYRAVIADVLQARHKRFFVEDNTWNILCYDRLLQMLPSARLVHIYRDPRDVVASYQKEGWSPADPAHAARFYEALMATWWQIRERVPAQSFLEVSLEDLISSPREVLTRICEFWDMEWDEALLKTDLSKGNVGRWKKDFSATQQETIKTVLAPCLQRLGYGL